MKRPVYRNRHTWTPEEEQYLIDNYIELGINACAAHFPHLTKEAVRSKIQAMQRELRIPYRQSLAERNRIASKMRGEDQIVHWRKATPDELCSLRPITVFDLGVCDEMPEMSN